jgi:hypothetical protein
VARAAPVIMVIWLSRHLVIWLSGYLVIWSFSLVETTPMFTIVSPFFSEGTARMNMTMPVSGAVMS